MHYNRQFIKHLEKADTGDRESINFIHDFYYEMLHHHLIRDETFNKYIEERAKQDLPYSLYQYGLMTLKEGGLQYLKRSVELGCAQAYLMMASYIKKNGPIEGFPNQKELYELYKNSGHTAYQLDLAIKNKHDERKMVTHLEKAMDAGSAFAAATLGEYFHDRKNYKLAKKYYLIGCKMNNTHCYFNLAVMYMLGELVKKSKQKALELFLKALELDNNRAALNIGSIYLDKCDEINAEKYFLIGTTYDDPLSHRHLGLMYLKEDPVKALKMFAKGAALGDMKCGQIINAYGVSDKASDQEINTAIAMREMFRGFGSEKMS